jgi:hypothetical protein
VASRRPLASAINNGARSLSSLDQNFVTSPYPDITIPDVTLVDFVWDMVDKFPNYTALVSVLRLFFTVAYIRCSTYVYFLTLKTKFQGKYLYLRMRKWDVFDKGNIYT